MELTWYCKKKRSERSPWSCLPDETVQEIMSRIPLKDRVQFRVVCKNWKQLIDGIVPMRKFDLPWTLLYSSELTCRGTVRILSKLYDPSRGKTYTVKNGYMGEDGLIFAGAEPMASKHGWVLFCPKREFEVGGESYAGTACFVYCPFTDEIVDLPELSLPANVATFSSAPTSSDCVFFVSHKFSNSNSGVRFSVCRWGDENWKTFTVSNFSDYHSIKSTAFLNEAFYCLYNSGGLGVFDIAKQKWFFLKNGKRFSDCSAMGQLIESDGKLLRICFKDWWTNGGKRQLWRFDFSLKDWVEEASLGRRAAFIGDSTFSIPAVGEASEFADTVIEYGRLPYSFKTGNYHTSLRTQYANDQGKGLKAIWIEYPAKYSRA